MYFQKTATFNKFYTRKIAKHLGQRCELIVDYKNTRSEIWYVDTKNERIYNYEILWNLGKELASCDGFIEDSMNFECNKYVYLLRGDLEQRHIDRIKDVFKKHDVSRTTVTINDFL